MSNQTKVYILQNLGCANCAAKMEKKINALPGIESATITYATKQLRVTAEDPDALLSEYQKICASIESEVTVTPRQGSRKHRDASSSDVHRHSEPEACGCGHDHDHEHHQQGDDCGCGHEHDHHNENCGCGQDHAHEHHHHGDDCSCGQDHAHEHHHHSDDCSCGQDHAHEHHHHGDDCSYGHEHDHHDENCGCGQDHAHEPHHHGDDCGCGHDHTHEHHHRSDECGCGHEHAHEPHHHGDDCGCGHDHTHEHHHHSDDCGCGHDHTHEHHHHSDECGCGHDHTHEHHHHSDECGCGHDHAHHHHEEHLAEYTSKNLANCKTKVYILENLGCANCAAKMEKRINDLPGVDLATITYATKQLRVSAPNPDVLVPEFQRICASIESEVKVVPRASSESPVKKSIITAENRKEFIGIGIGAVLFIVGILLEHIEFALPSAAVFVIAYLILGGEVLITAARNLTKGQIFDENFLMSIATLGAFAIADFPEAVGVMLFYRIGELFEHIAVERSRTQIMDAVDMRPETVTLIQGDSEQVIPAEEAEVGDIISIRPGDRIPLDGIVIWGESRIDTSPVTGEPVPVTVRQGDALTSGCVNTSGLLKMRVEKVLEESMVTRILDSVENAAANKPQIERFITRFARVYTPFVVILALGTAILPSLFTGDWNKWIYTAITFLVISCPCALVLSVPLAFFSGIGAGSKLGILFKGGVSLEAMTNVKTIVMDKTGTITQGNFNLQEAIPADGTTADTLLAVSAACEQNSTHPIAVSILTAAAGKNLSIAQVSEIEEIAGHGIRAVLPTGEALCGNRKLMERFGIDLGSAGSTAYGTEVYTALDGKYIGRLVIADTIKPDAKSAITQISALGIRTAMLTGDAAESADAVARETGIDEVHARLLPQDKLSELSKIRNANGSVMFVGDGINDAPVLAGADVGAAMGSGADAAIEAADVVFMTSNMAAIPQSLKIARSTSAIAKQNVVFALAIKALVMVLGLAGFANMWMAVFADTGVAMLCVLNSIRILYQKNR